MPRLTLVQMVELEALVVEQDLLKEMVLLVLQEGLEQLVKVLMEEILLTLAEELAVPAVMEKLVLAGVLQEMQEMAEQVYHHQLRVHQ